MLGANLVFQTPLVGEYARKSGSTLACAPDAERLLNKGEPVGSGPEGFKGVGKPFSERYKLQRFAGGFVAGRCGTKSPIIPKVRSSALRRSTRFLSNARPWLGSWECCTSPSLRRSRGSVRSVWCRFRGDHRIWGADLHRRLPGQRRRRPDVGFNLTDQGARDDPADALAAVLVQRRSVFPSHL